MVTWGKGQGQQGDRVHSVGLRSLNHTAKELMHHSAETRGAPPVPPPTTHVTGDPRQAELSIWPGLGWGSSKECYHHLLSFPAPQGGVRRLQGWGGSVLLTRSGKACQMGAGFRGGAEAAPVPSPLYMGGSLQSTISRSFL